MTIRPKVIALVGLLFAVLIAMEFVIQEYVLMPSFEELERGGARTSMARIGYALDRGLARMKLNAQEWSNWAELYQFMKDFNPGFISTYTTADAMAALKVNLLLLVDREGKVVFATARELDSGAPLAIDLALRESLPQDFPWRRNLAAATAARGLVRTNRGVMMLAAAPILDGSGAGTSLGLAIMGRLLTAAQLHDIGTQAQAELSMQQTGRAANLPELVETPEVTDVYRAYDDIYGRPVMTLKVSVPRSITAQGHAAVIYSMWYLFGAAITILVLLLVMLNRIVLKKVARVTRHAIAVGDGGDLTARLGFAGGDEIGQLAREFDRMVERVAESRRQLADQSFQAGFAELAKGVMHNLGNAMTPLGVRLSMLAGRLRSAPVADVAAAAAELANEPPDAERRADLAQFVKLGCEQIEAAIAGSCGDVAVMERQSAIVTAALAEQVASARHTTVLESVRLPELLAQTLDIVPDICRRRLVVDADDSLRAVGAVTVARTVLRLVLQNLIINAADAVREAGLSQGALRLTADIERDAGVQRLHIQCEDNGVGIAPEELKRVFEKGYSTKSRDTNQGIGLHWCANAIRALGGRMWAASEGRGRGASMHIVFPIAASLADDSR
jgi:sensor domain CHASE-containing protein